MVGIRNEYQKKWHKEKYANDEEFREKIKKASREYQKKMYKNPKSWKARHPEKQKEYFRRFHEKKKAKENEKEKL